MRFLLTFFALILLANTALAQNDLRKSTLKSTTPSDEIVSTTTTATAPLISAFQLLDYRTTSNPNPYTALEKEITRLYYTGQFEEYARRIAEVPAK